MGYVFESVLFKTSSELLLFIFGLFKYFKNSFLTSIIIERYFSYEKTPIAISALKTAETVLKQF